MITVIFGTHNRLPKLKRALESVARDNPALEGKVEVLVADGGSTDGTIEYLQSKPFGLDVKFIGEGRLRGVTRCYNRLFRMAKHPLLTWISDDCRYEPGSLPALVNRINAEPENTLVGCYVNNDDKLGWVEYTSQKACTVGGARKSLYEGIDFWSEDYLTYASDIDFCCKLIRSGGRVVFEPKARVFHEMDHGDFLHKTNTGENIASNRFDKIYKKRRLAETGNMYPDILIKADTIQQLVTRLDQARIDVSWGNFYCKSDFGYDALLRSMNVRIASDKQEFDLIF